MPESRLPQASHRLMVNSRSSRGALPSFARLYRVGVAYRILIQAHVVYQRLPSPHVVDCGFAHLPSAVYETLGQVTAAFNPWHQMPCL